MLNLGFMQGRLSPMINNKIQCFPWPYWEAEFEQAQSLGFSMMEWTIDQDRFYENPLISPEGQNKIKALMKKHQIQIPSVTGDCFMQAPFYKADKNNREKLIINFRDLCESASKIGAQFIVIPLVDDGALKNKDQEDNLHRVLMDHHSFLKKKNMKIVFESDYQPVDQEVFISRFPADTFGINFDSGNSASFGFNSDEEFELYGDRILNVHIKDRVRGGATVPLGQGSCDFEAVFSNLKKINYSGNLILQTARASNEQHQLALQTYKLFVEKYFL